MKSISILCLLTFTFTSVTPPAMAAWTPKECWNGASFAYGDCKCNQPCTSDCCASAGNPVTLTSGDETYTQNDISINGLGPLLEVTRTYHGLEADREGPFGYGWSHNLDAYVLPVSDGKNSYLIKVSPDQSRRQFLVKADGSYQPPSGIHDKISKTPLGIYVFTRKNGTQQKFSSTGKIRAVTDTNGNKLTITYDASDRFIRVADSSGRSFDFTYNGANKITAITDAHDRTWHYGYDANNNLTTVTSPVTAQYPQGLTTTYAYDDKHMLVSVTDPRGNVQYTNVYDSQNRIIEQKTGAYSLKYVYGNQMTIVTDPRGFKTEHYFNNDGTTKKEILYTTGLRSGDPSYYVTSYEYLNSNAISKITYPDGRKILYAYDANGDVLTMTQKANANGGADLITSYTYVTLGDRSLVKTTTDAKGFVTTNYYDFEEAAMGDLNGDGITTQASGNIIKVAYPAPIDQGTQPVTLFTYNNYGQLQTQTDPSGTVTKYEYTPQGYVSRIVSDYGGTGHINAATSFTYDNLGNKLTSTDPLGHVTNYSYDALGRLLEVRGASCTSCSGGASVTRYEYDENGNRTRQKRQTDETGNVWQITDNEYDSQNQLISITSGVGSQGSEADTPEVTRYGYDPNGNRTSVTDANGNITTYSYDERGLLWQVSDSLSNITEYAYDLAGNLKTIKDAKGNITSYEYDGHNRLIKTIYPNSSFEQYVYDANSNLINKRDRKGQVVVYAYDALNRLTQKTYPDATAVNYTYDLASRLTRVTSPGTEIVYVYDTLNRVTSVTTPGVGSQRVEAGTPGVVGYEYDKSGNRTKLIYPDSSFITYLYDQSNRLTDIKDQAGAAVVTYVYDELGRLAYKTLANGVMTTYTYDDLNRLTSLVNKKADNTVISSFTYTYDNVGNRISKTTPTVAESYAYDKTYQLTGVTANSQTTNYAYDKLGNRVNAEGKAYTSNNLNQYTQIDASTFTYDNNGNMNTVNGWSYAYDYENRLISASNGTTTASYAYDPMGRRIQKTVGGAVTNFVYDNDQIIAEYDSTGVLQKKYVNGQGIDEVLITESSGQKNYLLYDGLGSVTEVTNSTGDAIEKYRYSAFGQTSILDANDQPNNQSAIGNARMFTGREFDAESGLYHYRARAYSPEMGRFLQEDPIGFKAGDFNLYRYVRNNPLIHTDPFGEQCCENNSAYDAYGRCMQRAWWGYAGCIAQVAFGSAGQCMTICGATCFAVAMSGAGAVTVGFCLKACGELCGAYAFYQTLAQLDRCNRRVKIEQKACCGAFKAAAPNCPSPC